MHGNNRYNRVRVTFESIVRNSAKSRVDFTYPLVVAEARNLRVRIWHRLQKLGGATDEQIIAAFRKARDEERSLYAA